ncbi:MAG: NAD(+) synthetase, partial [Planctomycetota bacterium]
RYKSFENIQYFVSYNPNNYNYPGIIEKIGKFILNKTFESNSNGIVIGLSGGIDSSVCLALVAKSLPNHNILGLIMPMNGITPEDDEMDAVNLANTYNIEYRTIPINNIEDSYKAEIYQSYSNELNENKVAQGNLLARIRMSVLYYHANLLNRIVVGTGNKSEAMLGYFTKYGDGGVDIAPIADLYKTQVRVIAKELGISNKIINKKSGPRLWINHDAEDELNMTYDDIDPILFQYSNNQINEDSLSQEQKTIFNNIKDRNVRNNHKNRMPEICILD